VASLREEMKVVDVSQASKLSVVIRMVSF